MNVFAKEEKKRQTLIQELSKKFEYYEILKNKINLFCFILYNFTFLSLKTKNEIFSNELFLCVIILSRILLDDYNINKTKFFHILKNFDDFNNENLLEYQIDLIKVIFNIKTNDLINSILETQGKIIDFTYNDYPGNNPKTSAFKNMNLIKLKTLKSKELKILNKSDSEENLSENSSSIDNMIEEINNNFNKKNSNNMINSNNNQNNLNNNNLNNSTLSRNDSIIVLKKVDSNIIKDVSSNYKIANLNLSKKSSNSKENISFHKHLNNENSEISLGKTSIKRMNTLKLKKVYKNESSNNEDADDFQKQISTNSKNNSNIKNSKDNSNSNNNSFIYILNNKHFVKEDDKNLYSFYQKQNTENQYDINDKKLRIYKRLSVSPKEEYEANINKNFQNQKTFNYQFDKENEHQNKNFKNSENYNISHNIMENNLDKNKITKINPDNNSTIVNNRKTKNFNMKDSIFYTSENSLNFKHSSINQNNRNSISSLNNMPISPINYLKNHPSINSTIYDHQFTYKSTKDNHAMENEKKLRRTLKTDNLSFLDESKKIKRSETILVAETFLENYLNRNQMEQNINSNLNTESESNSQYNFRKTSDFKKFEIIKDVENSKKTINTNSSKIHQVFDKDKLKNENLLKKYSSNELNFNSNIKSCLTSVLGKNQQLQNNNFPENLKNTNNSNEIKNEYYNVLKNKLLNDDFQNKSRLDTSVNCSENSFVARKTQISNEYNNLNQNNSNNHYINFNDLAKLKCINKKADNNKSTINDNSNTNNSFISNLNESNKQEHLITNRNNNFKGNDNMNNKKMLILSPTAQSLKLPVILVDSNKKEEKVFNSFRRNDSFHKPNNNNHLIDNLNNHKILLSPKNNSNNKSNEEIQNECANLKTNTSTNKQVIEAYSAKNFETSKSHINQNNNDNNNNAEIPAITKSKLNNIYKNIQGSNRNFDSDSCAMQIRTAKRIGNLTSGDEMLNSNLKKGENPIFKRFSNFKYRGSKISRDKDNQMRNSLNTRNLFNNMLRLNTLRRSSINSSPMSNKNNNNPENNLIENNQNGHADQELNLNSNKKLSRTILEISNNNINNNSFLSTIYNKHDLSEYNSFNNNIYNDTSLNNENSPISKNPNDISVISIHHNLNTPKYTNLNLNSNNNKFSSFANANSNNFSNVQNQFNKQQQNNSNNIFANSNIYMDITVNDESLSNIHSLHSNNSNTSQFSKGLDSNNSQSQNTSTHTIVNNGNTPKNSNYPNKNLKNPTSNNFRNLEFNEELNSEKNFNSDTNKYNTKFFTTKNTQSLKGEGKSKEILKENLNINKEDYKNNNIVKIDNLKNQQANIEEKINLTKNGNIFFPKNDDLNPNDIKNDLEYNLNKTDLKNLVVKNENSIPQKDQSSLQYNNNKLMNSSFTSDQSASSSSAMNIASAFTNALKVNKKRSKLKELFALVNRQATIDEKDETNEIVKDNLIKKFSNKVKDKDIDNKFNEFINNIERSGSLNFIDNYENSDSEINSDINTPNLLNDKIPKFDFFKKISLNPEKNKGLILFIKDFLKNNENQRPINNEIANENNNYEHSQSKKGDKKYDIFDKNNDDNKSEEKKLIENLKKDMPSFLNKIENSHGQKKSLNKDIYNVFNNYLKVLNLIDNIKVKEFELTNLLEKDNFYGNSVKANFDIKNRIEFICLKFYFEYLHLSKEKREEVLEKKYSILRKEKKKYFKITIKIKLRNQDIKELNINENNDNKKSEFDINPTGINDNSSNYLGQDEKTSSSKFNNNIKIEESQNKHGERGVFRFSPEEIQEIQNLNIYMKSLVKSPISDQKNAKDFPKLSLFYKFDFYIELFEINYIGTSLNGSNNNNTNFISTPKNLNSNSNTPKSSYFIVNNKDKNNNEKVNKNFTFIPISNSILKFEDFISLSYKLDIFQTLPFNANLNYINCLEDFIQEFLVHHFSFNFDKEKSNYTLALFPYRIGVSEGRSFEFPFFGKKCTFDILINKFKITKNDCCYYNLNRNNSLNQNMNLINNQNSSRKNSLKNMGYNFVNVIQENSPVGSVINNNSGNFFYINNNSSNINTNYYMNNKNNSTKLVNFSPKDLQSPSNQNNMNSINMGTPYNNMSFFHNSQNDYGNHPLKLKSNSICMVIKETSGERKYIRIDMEIDDNSFVKLFSDLNNNLKDFFGINECLKSEKNETIVDSFFYKDKSLIMEKGTVVNILLRTQEIFKYLLKSDLMKNEKNKKEENLNSQNTVSSVSENIQEITFQDFLKKSENSLFKISINNNLRNIDLWRISKDEEEMKWYIDYSTIEKIHSKINFYLILNFSNYTISISFIDVLI